jgi:hypothetical protein
MKGAKIMTRGKSVWTVEKYNRFIKEGRGQGEGINYKPFWTITDFPTYGRASRILGWKTGRIHHFFSDIEKNLFLLLDFDENNIISDIREHYPLLNLEETIDTYEDLKLYKFKDKETGEQYVITTTFLITLKDISGKVKHSAISVKGSSELNRDITIERLEIERRFWEEKNIPWAIITDKEIPKIKCKNIEWIHSTLRASEEFGISDDKRTYYKEALKDLLVNMDDEVRNIIGYFEQSNNLNEGMGLYIFKYLIANREIKVDLDKEIKLDKTVKDLILGIEGVGYGTAINY